MNKYFLPATFLMGTLVLLFVYSKGFKNERGTATTGGTGKVPYMQVHQYKQETAMKIGIKKDEARFRKNSANGELAPADNKKSDYDDLDLAPEENVGSEIVGEDSYQQAVTLDQQMDSFLAKQQEFNELESIKKKAYVDAFKREALAMGFIVEIDENMQIQSVTKVKNK